MNKFVFSLFITLLVLTSSCKKGCTDPLAYNYKPNKTVDNGKCKYYDLVYLDSIKISRVRSQNSLGNNWDSGDSLDYDNDNSNPDISLKIITPSGYNHSSVNMYTNVNPFDANILFEFNNDYASDMWSQNGFLVYVYDFEMNFSTQLIDSLWINPFNSDQTGKSNRFQKEVEFEYNSDGIGLVAYFRWE
jgi:hypothetical protein